MINKIKELIAYRYTIIELVKRDLRGKYKGSVLGFMWNLVIPLCQILVYIMVFSQVMRHDVPNYYLFLVVAMMPWLTFSDCVQQGSSCIVNQSTLVSKIYFPNEILPLSVVIARFINLFLTFLIIFALIILGEFGFNFIALAYLPIVVLIHFILSLGMALLFSAISVYLRDVQYILQVVLSMGVWITPVLFETSMVEGVLATIMQLNPISPIIIAYRDILYYQHIPNAESLKAIALFSVVLLILAEAVFIKLESGFAEQI